MNEKIREDILGVLRDATIAIRKENSVKLREISDHTLHNANIYQDPYSIGIAVTMYALSKIYARNNYKQMESWNKFDSVVKRNIKKAKDNLEKSDFEQFDKNMANINLVIEKLDNKLKEYIKEVVYRAHISKGSRFYEHGLSIGRTAQLLGINTWDLMEYIGKTGISDKTYNITKSSKQRLKEVRKMFGMKPL